MIDYTATRIAFLRIALGCLCLVLIAFPQFTQAHMLDADWLDTKSLKHKFSQAAGSERSLVEVRLTKFEQRMQGSLNESELAACYNELNCLSNSTDEHAKRLFSHLIIELSDPSQVNQGNHNTCALAALQEQLYIKEPSLVCRTARQALSGKIVLASGKTVELANSNIVPDLDSIGFRPDTPYRSYASQLFQVAAANIYWQSQIKIDRGQSIPSGTIRYVQDYLNEPQFPRDTRERLLIFWSEEIIEYVMDENTNRPECSPCFRLDYINETYRLMAGEKGSLSLLSHKQRYANKDVSNFLTEKSLFKELQRLKRNSELPALISVSMNSRTFSPLPKLRLAGPQNQTLCAQNEINNGWHVVCITDFDESARQVFIDNFWGPYSDHLENGGIELHDLYLSSCPNLAALPERQD